MAGTKVSVLTAGAALGGTEAIPAVQSAATVKITAAQIKTFVSASPTLVTPVLGVATGTSLALGGATIGSNALAVTGSVSVSTTITALGSIYSNAIYANGAGIDRSAAYNGLISQAGVPLMWAPSTSLAATPDTGLSRISAGVIGVGTGAQGSVAGRLDLASMNVAGGSFGGDANWWNTNNLNIRGTTQLSFGAADVILTRGGVATLQHGNFDAASPVAQTIKFQDVVAGTSNTAGVNATIQAPAGTGTGNGGSLIFQVAPAGSSGTAKNAWATALTIASNSAATFGNQISTGGSVFIPSASSFVVASRGSLSFTSDGVASFSNSGATNSFTITAGASNLATFNGDIATGPAKIFNSGGHIQAGSSGWIYWASRSSLTSTVNGNITLTNSAQADFGLLQLGGTTSSFPAWKRSTTSLQARLADDSAFTAIQGKLTTDTAYTAGDPTTTGYIVVYDSTGTAYRVPALLN